jgi:integrase
MATSSTPEIKANNSSGQRGPLTLALLPLLLSALLGRIPSAYGKRIATILGLANPERYTGHCLRRTVSTLCADAGLTIPQMKAVTGHRSEPVLQGYIDNSLLMKRKATEAISTSRPTQPAVLTATD